MLRSLVGSEMCIRDSKITYPLFFMKDTLANTEKKTAYILTLPAVALVFAIILFPIFANVWISFKEVELKDIRIPEPRAKKIVKSISEDPSKIKILYKLRNSSLLQEIRDVSFQDKFPKNFEIEKLDPRCDYKKYTLKCKFGNWPAKYRDCLLYTSPSPRDS